MKAIEALKEGKFNNLEQAWQSDGSVIITLDDRKGKKQYKCRVKNLYLDNERELNIETGEPIK